MIWSPSTASPFSSTASMRSPSPSNAMPRSKPPSRTVCCSSARSVAPQPTLMFVAVGRVADRVHLGAAALERVRREPGVGAVRAVDGDPQAAQVGAEALEDVLQVRVGGDLDVLDRPLVDAGRRGEQLLDLLLGRVGQLVPLRVEELDAVVLGRVVRGGDDDAEVEREQRDRRRRQDAAEDAVAAGRDDAARERLFELDAATRACRARRRPSPRPSRAPRRGRGARRARA